MSSLWSLSWLNLWAIYCLGSSCWVWSSVKHLLESIRAASEGADLWGASESYMLDILWIERDHTGGHKSHCGSFHAFNAASSIRALEISHLTTGAKVSFSFFFFETSNYQSSLVNSGSFNGSFLLLKDPLCCYGGVTWRKLLKSPSSVFLNWVHFFPYCCFPHNVNDSTIWVASSVVSPMNQLPDQLP